MLCEDEKGMFGMYLILLGIGGPKLQKGLICVLCLVNIKERNPWGRRIIQRLHVRLMTSAASNTFVWFCQDRAVFIFVKNFSGELVIIRNEPGPLGIHVVPDYDRLGKDRGLLVQGIEPGGRIDRDGRLAIYDRIIEINGQNLLNMPFQR